MEILPSFAPRRQWCCARKKRQTCTCSWFDFKIYFATVWTRLTKPPSGRSVSQSIGHRPSKTVGSGRTGRQNRQPIHPSAWLEWSITEFLGLACSYRRNQGKNRGDSGSRKKKTEPWSEPLDFVCICVSVVVEMFRWSSTRSLVCISLLYYRLLKRWKSASELSSVHTTDLLCVCVCQCVSDRLQVLGVSVWCDMSTSCAGQMATSVILPDKLKEREAALVLGH